MVPDKAALISYKLVFGLLAFSAVVTEIAVLSERGTFNAANFFSFFTIQNNLLVALVFLLSAAYTMAKRQPRWLSQLRAATTVYITIVGLGFSVLLSGLENSILTAVPWDNTVLHYIIPVAAVVDFLLDRPQAKLRFASSLLWLLYPIGYLAYSLIRGAITDWYPYPFLNPSNNGYVGIVVVSVGLLALGVSLTWLACRLTPQGASKARRSN